MLLHSQKWCRTGKFRIDRNACWAKAPRSLRVQFIGGVTGHEVVIVDRAPPRRLASTAFARERTPCVKPAPRPRHERTGYLAVCWFSVKMTARLDVNATPGVRMSPLAPGIQSARARHALRAPASTPPPLSAHCLWAKAVGLLQHAGTLLLRRSRRASRAFQFPVPLRPDLWGLRHEVQRRNVAYRNRTPL